MNISPLNVFPDMQLNPSALEYFWHQLPYGVPGIFTFLVSIFLFGLGIYAASDKSKDKEKRFYFLNFAIAVLGYGVLGLVLALRSVMLDKALLLDWNQRIYFFVMIILPGSAYVVYYITDKRYKSSLWFARFSWASLAFGLFGILMGKAFTGEWVHYSFGNYPVATIYLKQWGIMGGLGFFFFVIPISFRYYRYSPEKFREKWMVIIAVDLLIFLVITNLPSFVGIPWFPGSTFAFIPMALLAYGVFRSDFLNLNDLLFKKGGAYYMVNVIMILVFSGIILGLASSYTPYNFEKINWFPWLLMPTVSVLAVFLLGIFIGGTNPTREINQFGSILLYQTGFLLFAIITLSLDMKPIVAHRLEQIWYIFFMLTPPVAFRFALIAFNQKMPKYGVFFDVFSLLFSAGAMSPYLFYGYYKYSFGNVSSSGPIVQLSAVVGTILAIIVVVKWIKIPKEKKTLLANTTVIFLILNNLLIFGNIPATMGYSLYTTSNFAIIPVGILAYGLIKNRSINMQQHAMQVSSRVSLILLFILPIFSIAFFSAQPDEIALKHRFIHILFISTPLFLLSFLILFLFTRPVAMRLDSVMRDLRKEKTETMRQKEAVEKAHLDVEKLNQLSRQIQSSTELQYILSFIIEHIKSNFPIDSLWLLLSSKEGDYLFTYQTLLSDTAGELPENLLSIQNLKISLKDDESIISHVCHKKKSFYVKNIPPDQILRPVDKEIIEKMKLDSVLYNPLISQNNLVGMIIFTCYREKMDLTRNDIRKLESICSQVAGSLNNAYLLEETKKSQKIAEQAKKVAESARSEIQMLNQLIRRLNENHDLKDIMESVSSYVEKNFGFPNAALYLVNDDQKSIRLHYFNCPGFAGENKNENLTGKTIPITDFKKGHALAWKEGKTLLVPQVKSRMSRLTKEENEIIQGCGYKSAIMIPLILHEEFIGFLDFYHVNPSEISKKDMIKLSLLGEHLAGIIHNASLLHIIRTQREESERLRELAQSSQLVAEKEKIIANKAKSEIEKLNLLIKNLNENLDVKVIMQKIAGFLKQNYNIHFYALYFVSEDKMNLKLIDVVFPEFVSSEDRDTIRNMEIPIDNVVGAHAFPMKAKRPFFTPDVPKRMNRMTKEEIFIAETSKMVSFLIIPLVLQNNPIGVLDLSSIGKMELTNDDINRISILGEHLAGIIHGADLFKQIREEKERTEKLKAIAEKSRDEINKLNEFSKQINSSTDLDEIIDLFFRILRKNFSVDSSFIQLVDTEKKHLFTYKHYYPQGVQFAREDMEFLENMKISLTEDQSLQYFVYTKKKSLHLNRLDSMDKINKMHPMDKKILSTLNFSSIFYVPLVNRDEVIGMVSVAQFSREKQLSKEDRNSIERYIEQISGAVYSSSLLKEVQREREASDALLLNILPEKTALDLKKSGKVEPLLYDSVSIMFTDFRGFTKSASEMLPEQLIKELDAVFDQFDNISARHHLEKIKTIGDAYMCAAGIPEVSRTHHIDICLAAMSIRQFMIEIKKMKEMISHDKFWEIRIGIHTGSVIAGVVGNKKFQYDMWGDNVNIASRMESYSEPQQINISQATYDLVKDFFECTPRGKMNVRGKGEMDMYFLERLKPEYSHDPQGLMPNKVFHEFYEGIKSNMENGNFGIKKETSKKKIPT